MTQAAIAPAVFITEEYVTFSDVLEGKLGPREAGAARFWVDQGSIIEPPPKDSNWVKTDIPAGCYDTRVWEPIEEQEDAGAAAVNLGNTSAFAAPAAQKPKQKTIARPRTAAGEAGQNMYSKAAFVGHSDTLGTLARRKARSSKYADAGSEDTEDDAGGAGGSRAATQNYELLPPSAALAKLPSGWKVYDLVLDGPRNTKVFGGRMYVSPSGIVSRSFETAKAMSRAESVQCRWPSDLKNAIAWIKTQGTSSRAAIRSNLDVMLPRHVVALQRRKTALNPKAKIGRPKKKSKKRKEGEIEEEKTEDRLGGGNPESLTKTKSIKTSRKSTPSLAASDKPGASVGKNKVEVNSNAPPHTIGGIVLGCPKCRYSQRGCQQCKARAAAKAAAMAAGIADHPPPRQKQRKPTVLVERLPKPA